MSHRTNEGNLNQSQLNKPSSVIALVGPNPIKFGSMLSERRRAFVLQVLRKQISQQR